MSENEPRSSAGLGMFASFLTGLVIAMVAAWLGYPHDVATRQDIKDLQSGIQAEINVLTQQQNALQEEVNANRIDVARLKEKEHLNQ